MRLPDKQAVLAAAWALAAAAAGGEARRVRLDSLDKIIEIRTAMRHTTVIALPPHESIADFVAGDTEVWQLQGDANIAYLKPQGKGEPGLVVHVEVGDPEDEGGGQMGSPIHQPAFVAASEVAGYETAAADAIREASRARAAAEETVEEQVESFRSAYPGTMKFEYRLDAKARRDPFSVVAMWNDGRHTYLRSAAPESPAIYESRDGQPSLVEYELGEDGLYVAQRVLRDGWLQIGKQRAAWVYIPARGLP